MKVSKSILILALAGVSGATLAAEGTHAPPTSAAFVDKAAQDGMTEVALGKLALAKSQDTAVKSYAQRMITDHGKANSELTALAKSKGIDAPKKLDATHAAMVESLESKEGADFDAAYAQHMNMDHAKALELFEDQAKGEDAELAGFARKTLPTLKEHKALAEKLASKQQY